MTEKATEKKAEKPFLKAVPASVGWGTTYKNGGLTQETPLTEIVFTDEYGTVSRLGKRAKERLVAAGVVTLADAAKFGEAAFDAIVGSYRFSGWVERALGVVKLKWAVIPEATVELRGPLVEAAEMIVKGTKQSADEFLQGLIHANADYLIGQSADRLKEIKRQRAEAMRAQASKLQEEAAALLAE